MGKITQTAIALMFAVFVVGMFTTAMYSVSPDTSKQNFTTYGQYDSKTADLLSENNYSMNTTTNNTVLNFKSIGENIESSIAQAQRDFEKGDVITQLASAFGLISSLTMNVLFMMLAVVIEGLNFVWGMASNLNALPPPWNGVGLGAVTLGTLGIVVMLIYVVLKLVSAYVKWDI